MRIPGAVGTLLLLGAAWALAGCGKTGARASSASAPSGGSGGAALAGAGLASGADESAAGQAELAAGRADPYVGDAPATRECSNAADVGSSAELSKPWRSSGCGLELPGDHAATTLGNPSVEWHVRLTGATLGAEQPGKARERRFLVQVPSDYNPCQPHRVVYLNGGCGVGPNGAFQSLKPAGELSATATIYVSVGAPEGSDYMGCYDNHSGSESEEWEAFERIHTFVERVYCVDNNRIFVAGTGSGATLANGWGCYFGGTPRPPLDAPELGLGERKFAPHWAVRGRVAVNGGLPEGQPLPCNGPAAQLAIHDPQRAVTPLEDAVAGFDVSLATNGCAGNYAEGPFQTWYPPANATGQLPGGSDLACRQYTGCPTEIAQRYPLVFCTMTFNQTDGSFVTKPLLAAFLDSMNP